MKTIISLILIISYYFNSSKPETKSKDIVEKMFASIKEVETLRFKLKKMERVNGALKYGEQDVKFNRTPKKIYTFIHKPNEGVELLWLENHNNDHAYVNPNGFPYVNVSLDPYGSNMRKGNHHTVHEVGFDYIYDIISEVHKDAEDKYNDVFLFKGTAKFENKDCYHLEIDFKDYKYLEYVVKPGETLVDIAYKNHISDFMILEKNPFIKEYDAVKPGQKIMIPNAYAKKTILYIDQKTYLPVVQKMYDEKGLYEQYEFYNLVVNSKIQPEEFSKDYKDYNF